MGGRDHTYGKAKSREPFGDESGVAREREEEKQLQVNKPIGGVFLLPSLPLSLHPGWVDGWRETASA